MIRKSWRLVSYPLWCFIDQDARTKFKFTVHRGGIQRKNRGSAFARLDAAGDTVMDPAEPGSSRGGHNVHFE